MVRSFPRVSQRLVIGLLIMALAILRHFLRVLILAPFALLPLSLFRTLLVLLETFVVFFPPRRTVFFLVVLLVDLLVGVVSDLILVSFRAFTRVEFLLLLFKEVLFRLFFLKDSSPFLVSLMEMVLVCISTLLL